MKILIIASHPDDEVLGCGGTIAKHIQMGHEVNVLILSQGRITDIKEISNASKELGVNTYFISNLRAQHFEMMPQSEIADIITLHLKNIKPDIVYTHSNNDLNKDHKVVYEATMVATRPTTDYAPTQIYAYEVQGSNLQPTQFNPTHYVNIQTTIDTKIKAMECYVGEINKYPQPRSIGGILIYAEFRGLECGMHYAEAFETIRTVNTY